MGREGGREGGREREGEGEGERERESVCINFNVCSGVLSVSVLFKLIV